MKPPSKPRDRAQAVGIMIFLALLIASAMTFMVVERPVRDINQESQDYIQNEISNETRQDAASQGRQWLMFEFNNSLILTTGIGFFFVIIYAVYLRRGRL